MKKTIILAGVLILGASVLGVLAHKTAESAEASEINPAWLENDSATAIQARISADFPLTRAQLLEQLQASNPSIGDADIDEFLAHHYLEADTIDGEQRFHRKSARNMLLLNPDYNGGARRRGDRASEARISYVDSVIAGYKGDNALGAAHAVTYRFSIDVPYHDAIADDTLRVWMPLALDNDACSRQSDVHILSATPSGYTLSGNRSAHNTIYFEAPSPAPGDTAHFEYTAQFITRGSYMPLEEIERQMKPYDAESEIYTRYTRVPDGRHIIRLDSLAAAIVGNETNPARQVELVYDYIIERYPWAGAREYSTIDCIPQYVLTEGHGDCGQVSLLFISLMRTLGVPARWESGWMVHPGEVNLHDWAEVYYEGIGWVPVDVSFGRYTTSDNPEIIGFYSHGIDAHRLAANKGVGDKFYPAKRYVRSETVDAQVGEVETSRGNLFYPAWQYNMQIINVEPIETK